MKLVLLSCLFCYRQQLFFLFPRKHLGRIIGGLSFPWVNYSSISGMYKLVFFTCVGMRDVEGGGGGGVCTIVNVHVHVGKTCMYNYFVIKIKIAGLTK